ncbi:DUF559 domain-containing protein [soil metagenome]
MFPGVYAPRALELSHRDLIRAAILAVPEHAYVSHVSALQLWGVDVGKRLPLHFTTDRDLHLSIPKIRLHEVTRLPPVVDRSVSIPAALVGAGLQLDLVDHVSAGDWMLQGLLTSESEIAEHLSRSVGVHGVTAMRKAFVLMRQRSESVRESRVRLMLMLAGMPEPELNQDIVHRGRFIARVDMLWRSYGVVLEYDGRQHAESVSQWHRDMQRIPDLEDAGLFVIRVSHAMLAQPHALVWRVYRILVQRGYRGPEPRFDAEWTALFARDFRA